MRPLLAAMLPLEAVVVELASERDSEWKGAIAEDLHGRDSWNLIDIRYKQHNAFCRCLIAGKRHQCLLEWGVPDLPLMLPGIAARKLRSGHIDNMMDHI